MYLRAWFFRLFPKLFWWYFLKTLTHLSFFLNSTTFYYLKLASHAVHLDWSVPMQTIHCLCSSTFQRKMRFMHRWQFTIKAYVNSVIPSTKFGRFAWSRLAKKNFAVSGQFLAYFQVSGEYNAGVWSDQWFFDSCQSVNGVFSNSRRRVGLFTISFM